VGCGDACEGDVDEVVSVAFEQVGGRRRDGQAGERVGDRVAQEHRLAIGVSADEPAGRGGGVAEADATSVRPGAAVGRDRDPHRGGAGDSELVKGAGREPSIAASAVASSAGSSVRR
jgi:hypothetical protein